MDLKNFLETEDNNNKIKIFPQSIYKNSRPSHLVLANKNLELNILNKDIFDKKNSDECYIHVVCDKEIIGNGFIVNDDGSMIIS